MTTPAAVRALDPQAAAFLEQQAKRSYAPDLKLTPEQAREASRMGYRFLNALSGEPPTLRAVEDHRVPTPAGDLQMRLYTPDAPGPLPILVFLHGGAFTVGDLESHDTLLRQLSFGTRAVVIGVNYRRAPEHPFPAATDDALWALRWAAAHAAELGGDAARLAVGGDSAGGNLAAVTALRARDEGGPNLAFQLLLYPNTDATLSESSWDLNNGIVLSKDGMQAAFDAYLGPGVDRRNPRVSPLFAPHLAGLPPALVIVGDFDPLRDEGEAYAARLAQAGVNARAVRVDGMPHGFVQFAGIFDKGREGLDLVTSALREAFAR